MHCVTGLVVLGVLDAADPPLLSFAVHTLVNSAGTTGRSRLVDWLGASLGDSSSWFRVFHSTLGPDLGIEGVDPVLVQTYVLDVLPESVNVPGGVESLEVGCRGGGFPRAIGLGVGGHVGAVRGVAHDRLLRIISSILAGCLVFFLVTLNC